VAKIASLETQRAHASCPISTLVVAGVSQTLHLLIGDRLYRACNGS
jgi:hypothetical protein